MVLGMEKESEGWGLGDRSGTLSGWNCHDNKNINREKVSFAL